MKKTFNYVQKTLGNFGEDSNDHCSQPPRAPLTDDEFRELLNPIKKITQLKKLRTAVYFGSIEPSSRKVVWKHIFN